MLCHTTWRSELGLSVSATCPAQLPTHPGPQNPLTSEQSSPVGSRGSSWVWEPDRWLLSPFREDEMLREKLEWCFVLNRKRPPIPLAWGGNRVTSPRHMWPTFRPAPLVPLEGHPALMAVISMVPAPNRTEQASVPAGHSSLAWNGEGGWKALIQTQLFVSDAVIVLTVHVQLGQRQVSSHWLWGCLGLTGDTLASSRGTR